MTSAHRGSGAGDWARWRAHRAAAPVRAQVQNALRKTIARCHMTTYHGDMTTWQALKRAGYIYPFSQLKAALAGLEVGVVAV